MFKFILGVEEVESDSTARTGRTLRHETNWPAIPQVGETIVLLGNGYDVSNVVHNLSDGTIEVLIPMEEFDFERLAREQPDAWEKFHF